MSAWALAHPWLTFVLILVALWMASVQTANAFKIIVYLARRRK